MGMEANKCSVIGCAGHIFYDSDTFDYVHPPIKDGILVYDSPTCSECGKTYKVIPYHKVVDIDENGEVSFPRHAPISDAKRRKKWVAVENEVDPMTKINAFIAFHGYSYQAEDIITSYKEYYLQNAYVSHTTKQCIEQLKPELEWLVAKGY